MTKFDKLKQIKDLEEKLSAVSMCLVGHNADCYCDFCMDNDTNTLRMRLGDIYGEVIGIRKRMTGEND